MNTVLFLPVLLFIGLTYISNAHHAKGDTHHVSRARQNVELEELNYKKTLTEHLAIESRSGAGKQQEDRKQKKRKKKKRNNNGKSPMQPISVQVNCSGTALITIATYGTNTSTIQTTYTGDWSRHAGCLMPCNPNYTDPCLRLHGGNCTCFRRKDYPSMGTCAVKGVPLGNEEYITEEK
uniref:Secreted protein n=1 Tax=Rhipicephalus appendiculatus TaxID=34631 RepID=A0A131YUB7_RHIAP